MELNEVKEFARHLKENIEYELKKFRDATGYTPEVRVETKARQTNGGTFVSQNVTVTLTVQ